MVYETYEADLSRLAWGFSSSRDEYEELMAVGREVFVDIQGRFIESKAGFRTWMVKCARNRMISELRRSGVRKRRTQPLEKKITPREEEWEGLDWMKELCVDDTYNPERLLQVNQALASMSREAQEVVCIILTCPEEILTGAKNMNPKSLRGQVFRSLRNRGWKCTPIHKAIKEIKDVVSNMP